MANKNIWDKLQTIDVRIIYACIMISAMISTVVPIGLPVPIGQPTRAVYDYIENLPPGSLVLMEISIASSTWSEMAATTAVVLNHILSRPLKVVITAFTPDSFPMIVLLLDTFGDIPEDKIYGEDYVITSYIAGGETGVSSLARSFQDTIVKDYYDTPVSEVPLLASIQGAEDFSLVIETSSSFDHSYWWVRQWVTAFNVPMCRVATLGDYAALMNFYPNQIFGILNGPRGGAEYEILTQRPGLNIVLTDAMSLGTLWVIFFVTLSNIGYIMNKNIAQRRET